MISNTFVFRLLVWTALLGAGSLTFAQNSSDPIVQPPPNGKLPTALVSLAPSTEYAFLVDKELRTITLWKNGDVPTLVMAHPTDMGKNKGNKLYRGDHKTPEGIYFFLETYEQPYLDYSLYGKRAFTMDYPNFFDRLEKKTGSGIWLHSIPDEQTLSRGSRGCVVVRNVIIEQLKDYISLRKTPIIVQNQVAYVTPTEWKSQRDARKKWLEAWRASWEGKDLEKYMSFYDESFKSSGMNWTKWKAYKESLNSKYSFIKVATEDIDIFKNNDQYIIRFTQDYQSDKNQDVGIKTLYARALPDGQIKILNEEWEAKKMPATAAGTLTKSSPHENPELAN